LKRIDVEQERFTAYAAVSWLVLADSTMRPTNPKSSDDRVSFLLQRPWNSKTQRVRSAHHPDFCAFCAKLDAGML